MTIHCLPETIEKFSQLDSKQLISAYLESIKNAPQQTEQQVKRFSTK